MKATLESLLEGQNLTENDAHRAMGWMADETVSPAWKGAFLAALRAKGETPEEIRGMATAMRAAARPLATRVEGPLIDTCGTGGDGSGSINVSTATALVLAASGVGVVKHGNRSVSSRSGSADVLEALGLNLPKGPRDAEACLARTGFTFLFAPHFHPAMKAVVPVRRAMSVRTVFNLLGPLTNPARPSHQVLGTFSTHTSELLAHALSGMEITRAFVVHGAPHWDEATPIGPFHRWEVTPGAVLHTVVDPLETYGIPRCTVEDLAGGDADENAGHLRAIFEGRKGAHRDAVVLNAALGLEVLGRASGRAAAAMAAEALDSGAVLRLLASIG
jgi:anthranilate phosphoribosyltransferase